MPTVTKQYFGITEEQVQAIGTYLVSRPFHEVEKSIAILRSLPAIQVAVETPVAAPTKDTAQLEIPFDKVAGEDTPVETVN